jgi:hypothetical protein
MVAALGDEHLVRQHLDADPDSIRTTVTTQYFPQQHPKAGGHIYNWTLGRHKSAHWVAREFNRESVLRLLLDRSPQDVLFVYSCEFGQERSAREMARRDPRISRNLPIREQRRIAYAAQESNNAAVKLMLECGWMVNARGQHEGTALHWAAWHGNVDLVNIILPHKPGLELRDKDFNATPLGWAAHGSLHCCDPKGNYPATVDALLKAGAEIPEKLHASDAVMELLKSGNK